MIVGLVVVVLTSTLLLLEVMRHWHVVRVEYVKVRRVHVGLDKVVVLGAPSDVVVVVIVVDTAHPMGVVGIIGSVEDDIVVVEVVLVVVGVFVGGWLGVGDEVGCVGLGHAEFGAVGVVAGEWGVAGVGGGGLPVGGGVVVGEEGLLGRGGGVLGSEEGGRVDGPLGHDTLG